EHDFRVCSAHVSSKCPELRRKVDLRLCYSPKSGQKLKGEVPGRVPVEYVADSPDTFTPRRAVEEERWISAGCRSQYVRLSDWKLCSNGGGARAFHQRFVERFGDRDATFRPIWIPCHVLDGSFDRGKSVHGWCHR